MTHQATHREVNPKPKLTRPDPEVLEKPQRRQFTAAYKQQILDEAERCTEPGRISKGSGFPGPPQRCSFVADSAQSPG